MADSFIKIQIEGTQADDGDVRLHEFIDELVALKNTLKVTERFIIKDDPKAISYRVVDLSHSSPATVTIGISARNPIYKDAPRKISRRLTTTLSMVRRGHRYAAHLDRKTLDTFKELTAPTRKHITRVVVTGERNQTVQLDNVFVRSLLTLAQPHEMERDEISGRLERLDVHNKTQFDIFPRVGPTSIRCIAHARLSDEILKNAGKWVLVDGWAVYEKDEPYPSQIKVESIYPQRAPFDLPSLSSLRGTSQEAAQTEKAEDMIRGVRDASW